MSIKLLNRVATALAAALIASPCIAADEATDEGESFIEEIIVTAEKREENIPRCTTHHVCVQRVR